MKVLDLNSDLEGALIRARRLRNDPRRTPLFREIHFSLYRHAGAFWAGGEESE